MLDPGDRIPDARVWTAPREGPVSLLETLDTELVLLCFYLWDWSPTWTNELLLLRDRKADLEAAGIRPVAISQDSPWSHESWAEALGVKDAITILSDWEGDATRAFDVEDERDGMTVAARSAFLVEAGTVRAAWMLGPELPDVDAAIASASSSSA